MQIPNKILIVDDEEFVTDTLEGLFHSKGYKVHKAVDGQACLDIIKNEKLDLILLDIKLPKMDGIQILKLVRENYPGVRVVIMTAYDMEYKTIVDGIGCDAFFIKPLLVDELTRKVEELLENKITVQLKEQKIKTAMPRIVKPVYSENAILRAKILIVSLRGLISGLLKDYFTNKEMSKGIYEVTESGLEQSEYIKKFKPDIILLDVALVGMLGEFGLTLMKMPNPPKEIILFGDPAAKWEEVETLIKRGTKFIEMPSDLHSKTYPINETIQRLNDAVREVCLRYGLFETPSLRG